MNLKKQETESEEEDSGEEESEDTEEDSSEEITDSDEGEDEPLEEAAQAPQLDQNRPPSTWRATAKSKWAGLDPDIQAEVLKREEDSLRGLDQYREKANRVDRIDSVLKPYEPIMRSKGLQTDQAIAGLMNTYYQLETSTPDVKKNLIIGLAQNYGIDLGIKQDAVQQALAPLQNELQQLKQEQQRRELEAQQRTTETAQSEIELFANEVDESGNPKNPYFENVRMEMGALITSAAQAGRNMTLQEAYDAATWSNPETRALIQAAQSVDKSKETQDKAKAKVTQAKKSAKTNLSNKGKLQSKQPKPTGSIDDTLQETMAELKARA